jgi:hypothetical protein
MSDRPVFVDRLGRRYQAMPGPARVDKPVRFYFWLSAEEREAIKHLADLNCTSMSGLLRDAVNSIASECGARRVFPPNNPAV